MCITSMNVNKLLLAVEDLSQIKWDLLPLLDLHIIIFTLRSNCNIGG